MARRRRILGDLDRELEDLTAPARWREWMGRVEAAIFASAEPVLRENLARVVGKVCNLELIIDDIREGRRHVAMRGSEGECAIRIFKRPRRPRATYSSPRCVARGVIELT